MRRPSRQGWASALALLAAALAPATATAQDVTSPTTPNVNPASNPPLAPATRDQDRGRTPDFAPAQPGAIGRSDSRSTIDTHQIDRYAAINKVREALKSDAQDLASWIILGELAHEAALDVPVEQSEEYLRLAREAYENAGKLRPDDRGIQAALRFVRDQEADAQEFNAARSRMTDTYLETRRREIAESGASPTLRFYGGPPAPTGGRRPTRTSDPGAVVPRSDDPAAAPAIAAEEGAPRGTTGTLRPTPPLVGVRPTSPQGVPPTAATRTPEGADLNVGGRRSDATNPVAAAAADIASVGRRNPVPGAIPSGMVPSPYLPGTSYRPYAGADGQTLTYDAYRRAFFPPDPRALDRRPATSRFYFGSSASGLGDDAILATDPGSAPPPVPPRPPGGTARPPAPTPNSQPGPGATLDPGLGLETGTPPDAGLGVGTGLGTGTGAGTGLGTGTGAGAGLGTQLSPDTNSPR